MLPLERGSLGASHRVGRLLTPPLLQIMYVVSLSDPVYHIAKDEHFTLCMIWILGDPGRRRRWRDRRLVSEIPTDRFTVLCKDCEARQSASLA